MKTIIRFGPIILSALFLMVSNTSFGAPNSCRKSLKKSRSPKWSIPREGKAYPKITKSVMDISDTKEIGRLIVERHRALFEADQPTLNRGGVNYFDRKVTIALSVTEDAAFNILETGQFLNYHQTLYTRGESTINARLQREDSHVKLALGTSEKSKAIRPKSAYLFLGKQFEDIDLGKTTIRGQYGWVFAVLKNDVKKRSLFATYDSLGTSKVYSFNISPEKPLKASKDSHGDYTAYFEALIYGDLTLDDVDYWIFDYDADEVKEVVDAEGTVLNTLLQAGQKAYRAKHIDVNGRHEVIRGPKIKLN